MSPNPGVLDGNALDLAPSLALAEADARHSDLGRARESFAGKRIGPYQLLNEIGHGGMGIVYRAQRADGEFEHEVAIKLLCRAADQRVMERFHQERQVLASLNHPNIARLYNGGTTERGRPYIVMEYVDGVALATYCARHDLDVAAKLDIVRQIAEAMQHAHQSLVVHRDIKSSNVLVTTDGCVKLLDFGIAKLLHTDRLLELTRTGERLLTPSSAAPEQFTDAATTVTTDVYQLGLLAYELLTGQPALECRGSFYEMVRVACEVDPVRPSRAAATLRSDAAPLSTGAVRSESTWRRRFAGCLEGDLDAIVLKALRKDPRERYASMEAFAADIKAYREARPVSARRRSLSYQCGRFAVRHRWGIAAATALTALLTAYSITVAVQSNRFRQALAVAGVEKAKAEQVSTFLIDLFESSDPNVRPIDGVTARELLERSRRRIERELAGTPEVQAEMSQVLGRIYYNIGAYDDSAALLENALSTRRAGAAADDLAVADILVLLGITYSSTGQYDEARAAFEKAIAVYEREENGNAKRAEALNALGILLQQNREHAEARRRFEQAIDLLRRSSGEPKPELPVAFNKLATLQADLGDLEGASRNLGEALALQERILGPGAARERRPTIPPA